MKDILTLIKESNLLYTQNGEAKIFSGYRGGGILKQVVYPAQAEDFIKIAAIIMRTDIPYTVLGAGFNCLIKDCGYDGLAISAAKIKGISVDQNIITCGGGEYLPKVAAFAAKNNLGGLEELSGIPSSAGGAAFMNAGAFGAQTGDNLIWADCFDIKEGKHLRLQAADIPFAYRNSGGAFDGLIICSVAFKLYYSEEAEQKTEYYVKERLQKQPKEPSLGCAFKNPTGYSAGYLIDSAGLKGYQIGGAAISEKHANFIVNKGGGTATDYIELMELAKATVYDESRIELVPEIRIIG